MLDAWAQCGQWGLRCAQSGAADVVLLEEQLGLAKLCRENAAKNGAWSVRATIAAGATGRSNDGSACDRGSRDPPRTLRSGKTCFRNGAKQHTHTHMGLVSSSRFVWFRFRCSSLHGLFPSLAGLSGRGVGRRCRGEGHGASSERRSWRASEHGRLAATDGPTPKCVQNGAGVVGGAGGGSPKE